MKKFYFVGGPKAGKSAEFFSRLDRIGGIPCGWSVYPHMVNDGKALHIVDVESPNEIASHLQHFSDIYDYGEIIEITQITLQGKG